MANAETGVACLYCGISIPVEERFDVVYDCGGAAGDVCRTHTLQELSDAGYGVLIDDPGGTTKASTPGRTEVWVDGWSTSNT